MMIFGGSTAADSSHTLMPASITSLRANLTRRSSRFEGQSRRVILPQMTPFIFTAAHTGLSLTWRLMIFVELLSPLVWGRLSHPIFPQSRRHEARHGGGAA